MKNHHSISAHFINNHLCLLFALILFFSMSEPAQSLTKDEAMTALLDAVSKDAQCQAAERLFRDYSDQLTATDRDYTLIHIEKLRCKFLQNTTKQIDYQEMELNELLIAIDFLEGTGILVAGKVECHFGACFIKNFDGIEAGRKLNLDKYLGVEKHRALFKNCRSSSNLSSDGGCNLLVKAIVGPPTVYTDLFVVEYAQMGYVGN